MTKKTVRYLKDFSDDLNMSNSNLKKILKFFLFECPVPGKSVRGKKFDEYRIKGSGAFAKLQRTMLSTATDSLKKNYFPSDIDRLEKNFTLVESVNPYDEYCVFLKYDERRIMDSLYSAIRNSFAHGSFRVKSYSGIRIYFLVNYDGYLKAEMILHEDTLLQWIECVKNFEK